MGVSSELLPVVTKETGPFWDAAKKGTLVAQKCSNCGRFRKAVLPETLICPSCLSLEYEWTPLLGRGFVYSFVVFHRAFHPAFQERVPYNVVFVQLDEGPQMLGNVVGLPNETLAVGMRVQVTFEQASDSIWLPRFIGTPGS